MDTSWGGHIVDIKNRVEISKLFKLFGPWRIRTSDQLIKSQLLYRTELTAPRWIYIAYKPNKIQNKF